MSIFRRRREKQLIRAAEDGRVDLVDKLLQAGGNPNAESDDGFTVLMWAAARGHIEVIKTLLESVPSPMLGLEKGERQRILPCRKVTILLQHCFKNVAHWPVPKKVRSQDTTRPDAEPLLLLGITEIRRLGEGQNNDLFAGDGADVMVQAQHLDTGDLLDHRFQDRAGRFDQMGSHLLEQVSPLLGGKPPDPWPCRPAGPNGRACCLGSPGRDR